MCFQNHLYQAILAYELNAMFSILYVSLLTLNNVMKGTLINVYKTQYKKMLCYYGTGDGDYTNTCSTDYDVDDQDDGSIKRTDTMQVIIN